MKIAGRAAPRLNSSRQGRVVPCRPPSPASVERWRRTFIADDFGLTNSLPITMLAVVGGIGSVAGAFLGGLLLGAIPIASTIFAANAIGIFRFVSMPVTDVLSFTPGLMGISLGQEPDGAASYAGTGPSWSVPSRSSPGVGGAACGSPRGRVITAVVLRGCWSSSSRWCRCCPSSSHPTPRGPRPTAATGILAGARPAGRRAPALGRISSNGWRIPGTGCSRSWCCGWPSASWGWCRNR